MKKYEYKCVFIGGMGEKTTRILNEYGRDNIYEKCDEKEEPCHSN